jgi:hypothetical protein
VGNGIFYMDIDNFIQYFSNVDACMISTGFKYSSIEAESTSNHAAYFTFKVIEQGEYFITIN